MGGRVQCNETASIFRLRQRAAYWLSCKRSRSHGKGHQVLSVQPQLPQPPRRGGGVRSGGGRGGLPSAGQKTQPLQSQIFLQSRLFRLD